MTSPKVKLSLGMHTGLFPGAPTDAKICTTCAINGADKMSNSMYTIGAPHQPNPTNQPVQVLMGENPCVKGPVQFKPVLLRVNSSWINIYHIGYCFLLVASLFVLTLSPTVVLSSVISGITVQEKNFQL